MKKIILLAVSLASFSTLADPLNCKIALDKKSFRVSRVQLSILNDTHYVGNPLTKRSQDSIEQKGYQIVKKKKDADFILSVRYQPEWHFPGATYSMWSDAVLKHIRSGYFRVTERTLETGTSYDLNRTAMHQDFARASNIQEYEAAQAKWKNYQFQDTSGMTAGEAALMGLPSCESMYH